MCVDKAVSFFLNIRIYSEPGVLGVGGVSLFQKTAAPY